MFDESAEEPEMLTTTGGFSTTATVNTNDD
jgi:hypothetical protein